MQVSAPVGPATRLPSSVFPNRPAAAKLAQSSGVIPTPEFAKSSVYIEYKSGKFTPKTAVSKVGNHILIRNMDAAFLKTTRPYGLSEQIDAVPTTPGTFTMRNKENDNAKVMIIVKP